MTILNVFKRIEEQKMLSVLFYKFKSLSNKPIKRMVERMYRT
jgi:hypothetical protein